MGKGEIALNELFLLFPQRFQKACFPGASKGVIVWKWVKTLRVSSFPTMFSKGFFSQGWLKSWLCGKGLTLYDSVPYFSHPEEKSFWKHSGKKEKSQFLFPHDVYHSFNPFLNKPWFLRVCITSLLKTLCEKEKLLIMSNFSFSHSVFYPCRLSVQKSLKFDVWEKAKRQTSQLYYACITVNASTLVKSKIWPYSIWLPFTRRQKL